MKTLLFLFLPISLFGQVTEVPEVAFLVNGKIIPIDSNRFEALLVRDTLNFDIYGNLFSYNYYNFHSHQSIEAFMGIVTPINEDSVANFGQEVFLPSYELSVKYIKSKTKLKKGELQNLDFDIVLYPSLRDSLKMLLPDVIGCAHYDQEEVKHLQGFVTSTQTMLDLNLPLNKPALQSLIAISKAASGETHRNCGADDLVNTFMFSNYEAFSFDLLMDVASANIANKSVIIQTVDSNQHPTQQLEIYYCPVWAPNSVQKISSTTNPIELKLPMADYYFWAGGENMDTSECECRCSEGIKVRAQQSPIKVILTCNQH